MRFSKTLFSLGLALFGLAPSSQAQRGLEIGLVLTPKITRLSDTLWSKPHYEYRLSYAGSAGLQIGLNLSNRWGLVTGLQYNFQRQGLGLSSFEYFDSTSNQNFRIDPREIAIHQTRYTLPLLLKINSSSQYRTIFVFMAGINLSLQHQAKYLDEGWIIQGQNATGSLDTDVSNSFAAGEMRGVIAFDGRYPINKKLFVSALIYAEHSLNNVWNTSEMPNRRAYNRGLGMQFGLHYILAL